MNPGTVAVSADEAGRYTQFAMSMHGLLMPEGSTVLWQIGNDIAGNRNQACERMEGDWLWFIDDDHAFPRDILLRLLGHLKTYSDIVAPVVLRRQQPFSPVACVDEQILDLSRYPADAVINVQHTGSAGMLIGSNVIRALDPPWFELGNGISEDVNFCRKAAAAGFDIQVDLGLRMGHITTCTVWPTVDQGEWVTGFTIADGFKIAADLGVKT